ncbi:toll/interleukin-1 receptor domain-containing protein [Streptomyces sp. NBC_00343]|uniref:toll/interleukin-1 receptor domain-containing protein n=1 Tax=Streptomyces sp. NBC_00343 TaxID=2975719 RepID=UPI002E2B0084|nr:toll/interleukin-1 receptor domain-containing protein [Streptomyces sp. NBC_00343]
MGEVFISHSARGDTFASCVLKTIVSRLGQEKNHTPWVDESDIPPGEEWRPVIVDWLARCDAAVVLLNQAALESTWVRREVNILMWRRALGAPLLVVPVLLGGLTTADVKMAGLEELRPIQFARTRKGEQEDAETLADKVLDRFADLSNVLACNNPSNPMSEWLSRLAMYLSEAGKHHPDLLADAARDLNAGDEFRKNVELHGGSLFLAHQFLMAPADRMEKALDKLAPALSGETICRLAAALSATWVNEEAARGVLPSPDQAPAEMTVLLNASVEGTARYYIRRAICGATHGYEIEEIGTLPLGEDRAGERVRLWRDFVWKEFFDVDTDEDRWLPPDVATRTHYLVVDERRLPDLGFAEAVRQLHHDFSWLIVVATTGTEPPGDQITQAFTNAVMLEPLLTVDDERAARLRGIRLAKLPERLAGTH